MSGQKRVAIIGAGFSGLTIAWALTKKNIPVEIFELSDRSGGLIKTTRDAVLVESAANAILANVQVEELLKDLDINPVKAGFRSSKRWIFRVKPRKMPLTALEFSSGLQRFLIKRALGKAGPLVGESVAAWAQRCLNSAFARYLVSPALQGVYGTVSENLSADIVVKSFLDKKNRIKKGIFKGSIAPENGMQEITQQLENYLKQRQVKFHFNRAAKVEELKNQFEVVVVAGSLRAAAEILKDVAPLASAELRLVPSLPVTSVTLAFLSPKKLQGFGCLFPQDQGFNSLGVLFNTDIFPKRGSLESETWILGQNVMESEKIMDQVLSDRSRLLKISEKPQFHKITIWPQALPLYGSALESFLTSQNYKKFEPLPESKHPLYLSGNYLGALGLAKILDYNITLSEHIKQKLGFV